MKKIFLILQIVLLAQSSVIANSTLGNIDSVLTHVEDYTEAIKMLAYKTPVDELKSYVKSSNNDLAKCKIYNALCWVYFNSDPPKAMEYAKLEYDLAIKLTSNDAKIAAYDNLAYLYSGFGENEKAINFMLKCLKEKEAINDVAGISVSLSGLANIYYSINNYQLALNYYNQVYEVEKKAGRKRNMAIVLDNMGTCYFLLKDSEKALKSNS